MIQNKENAIQQSSKKKCITKHPIDNHNSHSKTAVNAIKDIFFTVDLDGTLTYWNHSFGRISGYSNKQIPSITLYDFFQTNEQRSAEETIKQTLKEGVSTIAGTLVTKTGGHIPYEYSFSTLRNSSGNIVGVTCTGRDMRDDKQKEDNTKIFSQAIGSAHNGFILTDMQGHITYTNHVALSTFRYTPDEIIKLKLSQLIGTPKVASKIIKVALAMDGWSGEAICLRKNKKKFLCMLSISIVQDEKGTPCAMMGIFCDITLLKGRKKEVEKHRTLIKNFVEEQTKEVGLFEFKYHRLFESSHDAILILDPDSGLILDSNNYTTNMLGFSKNDLLGKKLWELGCCSDIEALKKACIGLGANEYIRSENIQFKTKDKRTISTEFVSNICRFDHTKVIRCDIRDITSRIQAELALKESLSQLEAVFEGSKDGLLVAEIDTRRFCMCNKTICTMLGYTKDELTHLAVDDIHPKESLNMVIDNFQRQIKGTSMGQETMPMLRKDGTIFYADLSISPLFIKGKMCLLGSFRDVTERLRLESMKNNFLNIVSHEIRTPLCVIKESFSLVLDGIVGPVNTKQNEIMTIAKNNIDRLTRLINQILTIQRFEAGSIEFNFQKNDINEVVHDIYETVLPLATKKKLTLDIQLDTSLPKTSFDRDKIEQVLLNLLENAIKFTDKNKITIRTSQQGSAIHVSIEDSGRGIRDENIPKLFKRFVQLDPKVSGTGLGLAISKDIIEAHKGKIWAESKFGKGSTFHFLLPK